MGIIDTLERRASLEDPNTPIADGVTMLDLFGGGPTWTGKPVSVDTALTYSAVYAAINTIASTIGALPLKVFQRLPDGGRAEAREHPLWAILHDAPNRNMSAMTFRDASQGHLLLRGNTYSRIETDRGSGAITALWPLPPDSVEILEDPAGRRWYRVTDKMGNTQTLEQAEVLHVAGLGAGNGIGYSVITMARQTIALGLGQEEFAARFFGNSSRPPGILTTAENLGPEAREALRASWEKAYGGLGNAHRVAVLDEGIQWQSLAMSNEDNQFLQSRQYSVLDVARWFNIPPHKIRSMENSTFTNIESQNTEYLQDTLLPWLTRWEQATGQQLLTPSERERGLYIKFVLSGLLRGDSAARASLYQTLYNMGSVTPNEVRELEDFAGPLDGGDVAFVPLNMVPLDQAEDVADTAPAPEENAVRSAPVREYRSPARRQALRVSFLPLLRDAAQRLVTREVRQLRRYIERYLTSGDPLVFLRALDDFYAEDWPAVVEEVMGPILRAYAREVYGAAIAEIGVEPDAAPVDTPWVDAYVETFGRRYSADSRRQISRVASAPVDEIDIEAPSVADNLDERLTMWETGAGGTPKSEIVARREGTRMLGAMTKTAFAAGGIAVLRWVTVGDNCPMCAELDGVVVDIETHFVPAGYTVGTDEQNITAPSNIGHPPLHDGCDCLVVPG